MTREESIKLLTNKKVFVKNKSSEIQEKLFSLGIYWSGNLATVQYKDAPFLYIRMRDDIIRISHGSNVDVFYDHEYEEITVDDILNITITEPIYRPFKNSKECWDEMLKHQPFGWLKSKNDNNDYFPLIYIDYSTYFDSLFRQNTFADGTPFGVKEG